MGYSLDCQHLNLGSTRSRPWGKDLSAGTFQGVLPERSGEVRQERKGNPVSHELQLPGLLGDCGVCISERAHLRSESWGSHSPTPISHRVLLLGGIVAWHFWPAVNPGRVASSCRRVLVCLLAVGSWAGV